MTTVGEEGSKEMNIYQKQNDFSLDNADLVESQLNTTRNIQKEHDLKLID